jgi:hypothetical protein
MRESTEGEYGVSSMEYGRYRKAQSRGRVDRLISWPVGRRGRQSLKGKPETGGLADRLVDTLTSWHVDKGHNTIQLREPGAGRRWLNG